MVDMKKVRDYYSRSDVQKAILEISKSREVVSVFKDGSFGKRPDVLQYPADIVQAVKGGAIAFHGSVERWSQPMELDAGMLKPQLDKLRSGWDIFIDVDVKDFGIAKVVVKQVVQALIEHGINSYSIKFTGGKSFHIGVPFEALPDRINMQSTAVQYPSLLEKIIGYIKWYTNEPLREKLLELATPVELAERVGKSINEVTDDEGISPFKLVTMDIFGSRHLFRLPYSLHEKSLLVSLPLQLRDIDSFEKNQADSGNVKVENIFMPKTARAKEAQALLVESLDWASKYMKEVEKPLPKRKFKKEFKKIQAVHFPPCISAIMNGLADGRKRSAFILINFLRNMGWSPEEIDKALTAWNEKNYPPLRRNYLRSQIRWHMRQQRNLLPPNCNNPNFYVGFGICIPDKICKGNTERITIKNPINYPFRKLKREQKRLPTKKKGTKNRKKARK
jgi:hypothetical protein